MSHETTLNELDGPTGFARQSVVVWYIRNGLTPRVLERALADGQMRQLARRTGVDWGTMRQLASRWGLSSEVARETYRVDRAISKSLLGIHR